MTITKIFVKSWNDIVARQRKGWIFRGQRNSAWLLETTLERLIRRLNGNLKEHASIVEGSLLREFIRRFHHYSDYVPRENDELEWFALMQHHGAPTRLLDWTMSIYVASYFALEQAESECAVWAIDQNWLHDRCRKHGVQGLIKAPDESKPRIERILTEKYRSFDELFGGPKRSVAPANPFRLNQRLTVQKGLFLCPGDISTSFMSNLFNFAPDHKCVQKIVLPKRLHAEFIERLSYMNVDRATLFPGLDGFASSLGVYQPHVQAAINRDVHLIENLSRFS